MSEKVMPEWVNNLPKLELQCLQNVTDLRKILAHMPNSIFTVDDWTCGMRMGHLKVIRMNGEIVGLINYSSQLFQSKRRPQLVVNINCMEIFPEYRGKRIASLVLYYIMFTPIRQRNVSALVGEAHWSAIPFWYSVGANMEKTINQLRTMYASKFSAAFILRRVPFSNAIRGVTKKEKW